MTNAEIIERGKEVIKIESNAVAGLLKNINEQFVEAVNRIYKTKGRIIITGVGKSGLIARKIVATLNSTGTAALYLHPNDALHGDLGMVRKEDILFLISKSGATEELVSLIPMLKRVGVLLVGMLGNISSVMAKMCDIVLDISVKEEACPYDLAPTASSTAALAMGDAIAIALLHKRNFSAEDFAMLHPGGSLGKRLSLRISEIMYKGKDIPIVNESSHLKDAIYEMTSKRLGATCVVNKKGKLVGIITDGDLRRLLEKVTKIDNLCAMDVMNKNPKTIREEYLASFALQKMENYNITSLVVTDRINRPIGFIHLHDLVKLGLQNR